MSNYYCHFIAKDEWHPIQFTRPQSTGLLRLREMLDYCHKQQAKPIIPEFKDVAQLIWSGLGLPVKVINHTVKDFRTQLLPCVSTNGGHFEHNM